jgi:hypothetical protein
MATTQSHLLHGKVLSLIRQQTHFKLFERQKKKCEVIKFQHRSTKKYFITTGGYKIQNHLSLSLAYKVPMVKPGILYSMK